MSAQPPTPAPRLLTRVWRALVGVVVNRPFVVSAVLAVLVAGHAVLTRPWPWINPYKAFVEAGNLGTAVTIYLFTAAAAALVAALAGIILVFVIGGQTPQIRLFREQAGSALRRTWVAVVAEPFVAAFLGVVAAITQTTAGGVVAPWLFELGLVLLAHGAVRLTLLLRELVEIVAADDERARREPMNRSDVFGDAG
jgi:hypothetical protein